MPQTAKRTLDERFLAATLLPAPKPPVSGPAPRRGSLPVIGEVGGVEKTAVQRAALVSRKGRGLRAFKGAHARKNRVTP